MTDTWTDTGDEARRWRLRTEEVRTMADHCRSVAQREQLFRSAESYDTMAAGVEVRLSNAPSRPAAVIDWGSGANRDTPADRSL